MTSQTNSKKREWLSLIGVVIIAMFIRTFVMELFFIPTGSMKQTLLEGEYVFSTKYSYGYSKYSLPFSPNIFAGRVLEHNPSRGDIVIFRPPHNLDTRYIKRLIGMPGDEIQIINDIIHINGKPISREKIGVVESESGKKYIKYIEILPEGRRYNAYILSDQEDLMYNKYKNTKVFHVPDGHYFFMGDNRYESMDSRMGLGFVPFENFIAKAQFTVFSTQTFFFMDKASFLEQINNFIPWITSIRFNRMFKDVYKL